MLRRTLLGAALSASVISGAGAQAIPPLAFTNFPPRAAPPAFVEPPAPPGTVAYNTWLGRMFNDVLFNERSPGRQRQIAERIVAADYIQHNRLVAGGRQGLLDFMPVAFHAIPDSRFILHDVFATEARVVTRWTWTGTLTGPGFLGIEPRGQRIEFDGIDIWSVRDGQLHEHWDQFDWPRLLIQLGAADLPAPFRAIAAQPPGR